MRSVLLGTGGRVILVIKWQGTWLNLVCVYCVWKIELVIEETRYLAGEISKQHVQPAWFYLEDFGKMWEERNYLKTKLWLKREAEFEDFENCQPICIEENRKDWERNRCVAIWPFEKEINQPSQQKPGVIEKNNGRIIPKAIQRLSELPPVMRPECRGPLVPSVDLGASCLAFPHTAGSCSFTPSLPSLATLVVAPVGWNDRGWAVGEWLFPPRFQRTKLLGTRMGSGLQPQRAPGPGKELLPNHSNHGCRPAH